MSHMRDDVCGKCRCGANADKLHKVEAETQLDIEELKFERDALLCKSNPNRERVLAFGLR